jgi:hypothetical protein
MNKPQKPESLKLSAREQGVKFLLGNTKVKSEDYPTAEWTRQDGNIFSVIATATNAWRRKDAEVAQRMRSLSTIAMTGDSKDAPEFAKALTEEADNGADGYYILLGILMEVTPNAEDDCDEDEDDDLGSDWDDDDDDDC